MTGHLFALAFLLHACTTYAWPRISACNVRVLTDAGIVCGVERLAENGQTYASFRGVPYAKQPLGELRFKELEPPEPWGILDARNEGPICFQTDVLYGKIMQPQGMSEACIHANIHVPMEALPQPGRRLTRELEPRYPEEAAEVSSPGLPILVFIHGGGFAFGSGDADLHGPEYLVTKKVIVITFNYRLNVFGFLSLNTTQIPGNAGLRDQVTLLRWVQRNAKAFGGDPNDVTIAGQSAGAAAAHLLTLSKATEGLFKRAILMSGTATSGFFSPSPTFAQFISKQLLTVLGITSEDPDDIYRQLIEIPAEKLCEANTILLESIGLTTFVPTVESPHPGVTTIIDDYPDVLIANGRGKNIPILAGYTSNECETFRNRIEKFGLLKKIKENPTLIVPPKILFMTPPNLLMDLAKKIDRTYYNGTISIDNFLRSCSDGFYEYPALKLEGVREQTGGAPVYVYRFSYEGHNSVVKEVNGLNYKGAGHMEDLTYVFKVNSVLGRPGSIPPSPNDIRMRNLMTDFFVNFMTCSKPICDVSHSSLREETKDTFQDIQTPTMYPIEAFSPRQKEIIQLFDSLNGV